MSASTHIRLNTPVSANSTNGVGYSIPIAPTALPKGVQTYMLTVANDGSDVVTIHPAGTNTLTGISPHRIAADAVLTIGPLHIQDGQPRLWSTADSAVVFSLDAVTGEA